MLRQVHALIDSLYQHVILVYHQVQLIVQLILLSTVNIHVGLDALQTNLPLCTVLQLMSAR